MLYCGGRPVFADIDKDTYNIDPAEVEKRITKRTKAIIAVDFAGQPVKIDELREIAAKNGLLLIEDAAHAVGALYKGKKVGSLSDMTIFSFHPVKQMTTCEGGMVTTNDKALYEKLKLFRTYGMVKGEEQAKEGSWFSEQMSLGYNYRLSDVQCALGRSQLRKLDKMIARRREIADRYNEELEGIKGIVLPYQGEEVTSSYHLYPILVDAHERKRLYSDFRERGVGVGVHYYPVYRNNYYHENGYRDVMCPVGEEFYSRELSLPVHYRMTDENVELVIDTVRGLIG